jgi:hypothetical protein
MPVYCTVMDWLRNDDKFKAKYDEARKRQAQLWVDQMMELAFTPTWLVDLGPDIQAKIDSGEVSAIVAQGLLKAAVSTEMQRRRLLMDTIKWFAGKMAPKLYGNTSEKGESHDTGDVTVETITYNGEDDQHE